MMTVDKINTCDMDEIINSGDIEAFNAIIDSHVTGTTEIRKLKEICGEILRTICAKHYVNYVAQHFSENIIKMIKTLLECGAEVNGACCDFSPLCLAVEAGSYALTELFCKYGANVNQRWNDNENTPLSLATQIGRCDIIELLLRYKANINMFDFSGSALDCALRLDNSECVNYLMQRGAKLDVKYGLISATEHQVLKYVHFLCAQEGAKELFEDSQFLHDLLILASQKGNLEIIGIVLDAGAIINPRRMTRELPLVSSKNGEVARFLIRKGANVHQHIKTLHGYVSPLMQVLLTRDYDSSAVEVAKVLLEHGAVVNGGKKKRTPLMVAATKEGSAEMLRVLLDHGANYCYKDKMGQTFLMHAVLGGYEQNVEFIMQYIQDKSTFINLQNNEGLTALMCSIISWKMFSVTQILIDNGADPTMQDNRGNTALLHALSHFYTSQGRFLKVLIDAGSDVNCQNKDGISPLMIAARSFMPDVIVILLKAGADVNAVRSVDKNTTAISFLKRASCLERCILCIGVLLDGGADSSYVNHDIVLDMIIHRKTDIIEKLIRSGIKPEDALLYNTSYRFSGNTTLVLVSPLCMALLTGNVVLAQYFVDTLFRTTSDVTTLAYNKELRRVLQSLRHHHCLNFLDDLSTQPISLFQLALLSVSSSVGSLPEREQRVALLPVPRMIKNVLLFKI